MCRTVPDTLTRTPRHPPRPWRLRHKAKVGLDHFRVTSHAHHDHDDVPDNQRRRPPNRTYLLCIKYIHPLVHMDDSDLCAVHTVGINLSTRMAIIWRQGKAQVNRLLGNAPPATCTAHESTCCFPYEIVEMIIAYFTHNLKALKACSMTCRSWYIVAAPHIHHTLVLRENRSGVTRDKLRPLSRLHELGLMPRIKEIRVNQDSSTLRWFVPHAFNRRDLRYFSAFTNVQTLKFSRLDIYRFLPDVKRYFEHFSPTLRSIVLFEPHCTPQQPSCFLSLFSNLDDIEVWRIATFVPDEEIPDTGLTPSSTPRLRGTLRLREFRWVETWRHLITSCGGLRFRYMDLREVGHCAPILLEACAETLETLRFGLTDATDSKQFNMGLFPNSS